MKISWARVLRFIAIVIIFSAINRAYLQTRQFVKFNKGRNLRERMEIKIHRPRSPRIQDRERYRDGERERGREKERERRAIEREREKKKREIDVT